MESKILTILCATILAPVVEELVYRAVLYDGLKRLFHNKYFFAVVVSGLVFGAVHFDSYSLDTLSREIVDNMQIFTLGFVTAFSYERTKNIFCPMLIHVF